MVDFRSSLWCIVVCSVVGSWLGLGVLVESLMESVMLVMVRQLELVLVVELVLVR